MRGDFSINQSNDVLLVLKNTDFSSNWCIYMKQISLKYLNIIFKSIRENYAWEIFQKNIPQMIRGIFAYHE